MGREADIGEKLGSFLDMLPDALTPAEPVTKNADGEMFGRLFESTRNIMNGKQYCFKFANGYGASVVKHRGSYGGREGKWELAVLGKDGKLSYDTPITSDVIGWLDESEVNKLLNDIEQLER